MRAAFSSVKRTKIRAFSLVEVVLALGVMSFSLMVILGMVPLGLSTLRESMDITAQSHMMQTLLNEAYATDRGSLVSGDRYFDESGQLLNGQTDRWFYRVRVGLVPVQLSDGSATSDLQGETLLIGIEARNHPVSEANWSMTASGPLPKELAVRSAVLLKVP